MNIDNIYADYRQMTGRKPSTSDTIMAFDLWMWNLCILIEMTNLDVGFENIVYVP